MVKVLLQTRWGVALRRSLLAITMLFSLTACSPATVPTTTMPSATPILANIQTTIPTVKLSSSPSNALPFAPTFPLNLTPTTPPDSIPTVDKTVAWGSKVNIITVPWAVGENYYFIPHTATPDGKTLIGAIMPHQFASEAGKLVSYNLSDHQFTTIRNFPTPPTQLINARVDDNWVTWGEGARQPDFGDWVFYALNRSTGVIKKIAQAPVDSNGIPLNSPYVAPNIDRDIMVWEEASLPKTPTKLQFSITVKSANLVTGEIKVLTEQGRGAAISWPNVVWTEASDEMSTQLPGAFKSYIVVLNLETGIKKILQKPETPTYVAIYKDTIVWTGPRYETVNLTDINETSTQVIGRADNIADALEFPTISDRLIAWTSGNRAEVWDRVQKRVVILNQNFNGGFTTGKILLWQDFRGSKALPKDQAARDANKFFVVDTSELPTTGG